MTIELKPKIHTENHHYEIENIRSLTESTFVLSLSKCRFKFVAGQHINLSIIGEHLSREYSIYSSEESENLEILVKEVEGGYFSPKIKYLKNGDFVQVRGPFGRFRLDDKRMDTHKHVFIASGTGIAPFHSMAKSYPEINFQVIHGVRYAEDAYEKEDYGENRYTLCTSRDDKGDFNGRLTEYLKQVDFDINSCFYLCGNGEMTYDAKEILKDKGFDSESINLEVYF